MKKLVLGMTVVCALILVSCGKNSAEYKALKAENDSLKIAHAQTGAELDEMLSTLNMVEDNFQSIKQAENYLTVQSSQNGEMTPTTRERITNDMQLIAETLQKNKEQIEKLDKQMKKSNIQSSELKKTIERMRNELAEKTATLTELHAELTKKDAQIAELSQSVEMLSSDVSNLKSDVESQEKTIKEQGQIISTVYYCFGTKKELEEQKILTKGQLGTDFNKDYFIKVKDFQTLTSIPLEAKSGKLISKHPQGTYSFEKDSKNKVVLRITDTHKFWTLTKFLVVEVSM